MQTNLYTITVPSFIRALEALAGVLKKAQEHADKHKSATRSYEEAMLNDRIVFDQFPLIRQVQIATDNAKAIAARLGGLEMPKFEDTEKTFEELQTRVQKTIEFLKTIPESAIAGKEDAKVSLPYWNGKHTTGYEYITYYLLPNFYFHVTTAYDICRKNGVRIGKGDFLGPLPLKA